MEQLHTFFKDTIRMGKKGQITVPKVIRDEDNLQEDDILVVTHLSGGEILLKKAVEKTPEDNLFEFLNSLPKIDWRKAWEEVREERKRSDR